MSNYNIIQKSIKILRFNYEKFWKVLFVFLIVGSFELFLIVKLPLLNSDIVNALVTADYSQFTKSLAYAVGISIILLSVSLALKLFIIRANENIALSLRRTLFDSALSGDLRKIESQSVGDLISRISNDVTMFRTFLIGIFGQVILDFIMLIVVIIVLIRINFTLTILVLLTTPVSLFIGYKSQQTNREVSQQFRAALSKMTSALQNWLASATGLKLNFLEQVAGKSFGVVNEDLNAKSITIQNKYTILEVLNSFLFSIPNLVILGYGGYVTFSGALTIGNLFAFMALAGFFLAPAKRILNIFTTAIPSLESPLNRIEEISNQEVSAVEMCNESKIDSIEAKDLTFELTSKPFMIDDFKILSGQWIAITGKNGSGKTSFAKLLSGLYEPKSGQILVNGFHKTLYGCVFFLSQSTPIFPGNVLNNLTLFDTAPDLLRLQDIMRDLNLWSGGETKLYEELSDVNSKHLSGGERQKMALCRAFYSRKPVIILDEPENFLESDTKKDIQFLLEKYCKGKIVFIVTHSPVFASKYKSVIHCEVSPNAFNIKFQHESINSIADK